MAGKHVAICGTELPMPETAGPVPNEGKARSPSSSSPAPLPTKICSHTCPWPSSWTSQTHAPSSGFGPKSPWMGLTCPGFSVNCLLRVDVGCWPCRTSPVGLDIVWTISFIV